MIFYFLLGDDIFKNASKDLSSSIGARPNNTTANVSRDLTEKFQKKHLSMIILV